MDSGNSLLRSSEEISYKYLVKLKVQSKLKSCLICIVRSKTHIYEQALFIIRCKSIFRKSKILHILPLTIELRVLPSGDGFSLSWVDTPLFLIELFEDEEVIKKLTSISNDYSRYQQEPFCLGCSHHKWVWYYQEYIPLILHSPFTIISRPRSLLIDHYGKSVMEAYVSEQLKQKEIQFTSNEELTIEVLTWNAGGNSPRGNLAEWLECKSKKYSKAICNPNIIVIGLQEMCELTKLRGDSARELDWSCYLKSQVESVFTGTNYENVYQGSLVGIMIIVLLEESFSSMVNGKASNQVKLGLKGFAGNKGALAFRFDLLSSSFCFINAHLAPHKQNFKLRNENVQTICRTIKFQLPNTDLNIFEHDFVFWFGDLNYRIDTIETKNIIKCIAKNEFDDCLKLDQLDTARRELNVLSDFSEGKIDFCPTFKYLIGSNQHNLKRPPAWCDRILWRGPASLHRYGCCDSIQVSDHKPVFSYFSLKLKRTDVSKMQEVKVQIYKEIDEIHHQAMPKALISQDTLAFPDLRYKISQHNTFEITNTGSSRFTFELIADQWVKCSPYTYNLTPNESVEVKVTITLNADYYKKSRSSSVNLSKFIRIKISNGPELLIELNYSICDTFMGYSCDELVNLLPSINFHNLPQPLVDIVEYLKRYAIKLKDLFEGIYDSTVMAEVVKNIDEGTEIQPVVGCCGVVSAMQEWLRSLKEPILNGEIVDSKVNMIHLVGFNIVKLQILDSISVQNANCLKYIADLMKTLVANSVYNGVTSSYLANKMYKPIFQVDSLPIDKKKNRVMFLDMMFYA